MPLPALLFHMMSDRSKAAPVDARLLLAFFGSCFIVFVIGRVVGHIMFHLDGVAQSVFALGGVFSNDVLLGVPLARLTLGPAAMPCVAWVLVFNALTLWTLVTVSVEWARHGTLSLSGLRKTAVAVLKNPIVLGILGGTLFSLTGLALPPAVDFGLSVVGHLTGRSPCSSSAWASARRHPQRVAARRRRLRARVAGAAAAAAGRRGVALAPGLPPPERQVSCSRPCGSEPTST